MELKEDGVGCLLEELRSIMALPFPAGERLVLPELEWNRSFTLLFIFAPSNSSLGHTTPGCLAKHSPIIAISLPGTSRRNACLKDFMQYRIQDDN